jgi:hypothetical protein
MTKSEVLDLYGVPDVTESLPNKYSKMICATYIGHKFVCYYERYLLPDQDFLLLGYYSAKKDVKTRDYAWNRGCLPQY